MHDSRPDTTGDTTGNTTGNDRFTPLTPAQHELLAAARDVAARAYAPYSAFRVGAAVLAADGRVFTGCNVENASYGLSLCAERAALARAVAEGVQPGEVAGVAVWCLDACPGPDGTLPEGAAAPCGACRQWLAEIAPRAFLVSNSLPGAVAVAALLPFGFGLEKG
ncbi:CMP/dCMP deaminase zinc-binding protein [Desulfovibrio sp. X2]|uniref:cytidine deaminase n=1 Tax=Desulfovibrio sp. X2 TaxID=941449 RepID=UPI0003589C50|nr:cytidine deaminase [Desulfovibrio sp. X2]EPR44758.1 CMP/dCMP deaminase zinc-binding protein [Desulfovibrio sp. X2]